MAGSGWGEEGASGGWHATRDFNFRNLQVQKGEKLPPAWQIAQNVKYLQKVYGQGCVQYQANVAARAIYKSQQGEERMRMSSYQESGAGAGKKK